MRATGLIGDAPVLDGHVVRIGRSYPVYRQGYKEHLASIEPFLDTFRGLTAIGRYGAFKYNNQDHSILMGILAAENILQKPGTTCGPSTPTTTTRKPRASTSCRRRRSRNRPARRFATPARSPRGRSHLNIGEPDAGSPIRRSPRRHPDHRPRLPGGLRIGHHNACDKTYTLL